MISRYKILRAIEAGNLPKEGAQVLYGSKKATVLSYKPTMEGLMVYLRLDEMYGLKKLVFFSDVKTDLPQGDFFQGGKL